MDRLLSLRVLLITGKGGVGKTTVAASLARFAARSGRRVLVAEVAGEAATSSPLADALGARQITEEPVPVAENLRLAVLAPTLGHQRFLRDVLPVRLLADAAMRSSAIRRFLSAAPTFPELGVLYRVLDLVRATRPDGSFEHELLVLDLPATGHALGLAQIPASVLRVIPTGPIAAAIRDGLDVLRDPARVGALVVTLPETLPVSEALELVGGLTSHRVPVAGVIVNRVPLDPFTEEERAFVRGWLERRPPTLGARTLERMARARAAVARATSALSVPVTVIREEVLEEPRLAEQLASTLAEAAS